MAMWASKYIAAVLLLMVHRETNAVALQAGTEGGQVTAHPRLVGGQELPPIKLNSEQMKQALRDTIRQQVNMALATSAGSSDPEYELQDFEELIDLDNLVLQGSVDVTVTQKAPQKLFLNTLWGKLHLGDANAVGAWQDFLLRCASIAGMPPAKTIPGHFLYWINNRPGSAGWRKRATDDKVSKWYGQLKQSDMSFLDELFEEFTSDVVSAFSGSR